MAVMPRATSRDEYERWFKEADKNNDGSLTAKEVKKMFKSKGYKTSGKVFKQQFASLDADSDNKVTLDEYLKAMGALSEDARKSMLESDSGSGSDSDKDDTRAAARLGSVEAPKPEVFEAWFKAADVNNDGFLSTKELKKMFKNKGYKTSSKVFKAEFATLDTDGDKKISLQEYMISMGQIPELEHKKAVDSTVYSREPLTRETYEGWFRTADSNNDGFLTTKEMKKMFKAKGVKMGGKAFKKHFSSLDADGDKKISFREYLLAMGQIELEIQGDSPAQPDPLAAFRPQGVAAVGAIPAVGTVDPLAAFRPEGVAPPSHPSAVTAEKAKSCSRDSSPSPPGSPKQQAKPVAVETTTQHEVHQVSAEQAAHAQLVAPIAAATSAESDKIVLEQIKYEKLIESSDSSDDEGQYKEAPKTHVQSVEHTLDAVREAEIRAEFQRADTNGDGLLDLEEMKVVLSKMKVGLTNKQMFDIMHKADTDGSGMINYNEFIVLWLKEHGILQ